MAKVTNLNRFRKTRAKEGARKAADANAVAFGRTKAARDLDKVQNRKAERDLDGKKTE